MATSNHCILTPSILASLNLPACIEEVGGAELPQSLLEKGETLREKGGIATLQTMLSEIPELLQRNKEIINEVSLMCRCTLGLLFYYFIAES